ncbi:Metal transporter cnnm-1 [Caenorhabditis elegans]|uniref:Metal transporter cnnm-1 n=1 Tax=Caenorhabditis elegans TaxID=6239 RepID=CNNM1_CAEEL|nr:Metal transporter cnnm-1 [Caenorhabditis elegans]A3QM97.1 RecName: Full=Metal transporter cnnm-1; AltName: Full=CNNM family homolog 1; Flags: Precursor [Caenorhabditis elegans]CAM36329.1 Metal transporter cnnm-1 [Caenorhabditis elegans]|eukprot:NP_503052.1 Metal transporter cnnm-1 [Caenorhabditis elegans]
MSASCLRLLTLSLFILGQCNVTAAQNGVDDEVTTVTAILDSATTAAADNSTVPTQSASNNNTSQSSKIPTIFGMRVELPADDPFGYDKHGVCSVTPEEEFKVVIYGNHLDKIHQIIWTFTNNCSEPAYVIDALNHFKVHFNHKATFHLTLKLLPEMVHAYKMCVKPKVAPGSPPLGEIYPLDDISTWLTTERPPKEYFLPLPLQIACIGFLLCLSALFSGLTLGLMSLTPQELELVIKSGAIKEQKCAAKILPVRKKGNLLLCSLLLGNVIVNSAISILMGELTTGIYALIGSTMGIVIFGEILPQSICVKKGLEVGAHTISITQLFIFLTFPIAWPVSKLLDCLLGDEYQAYDRKRLMELIKMSITDNGQVSNELKIAVGAMEIADKVVKDVMTKIEDVFMLPDTTVLNAKTVMEIVKMGYTRIPVYQYGDKNNVTDMLFVKDLALLDPDDNFTVKTVCGYHKHPVKFVMNDTPLPNLLEAFKKGEGHLAMVKRLINTDDKHDPSYVLVGVVTLEDIVEEILQAEINDEFDIVSDNVNKVKIKKEQNRDATKYFGDHEAPQTMISMQLQMVALQWLVSNERGFRQEFLDTNVLERLIRSSARRVDVSALMAMGDDAINVPRLAKVYTKDELSDKYILILEGRIQVTIGASGMMFEAGPWHHFGGEIMAKLVDGAATLGRSMSIVGTSELSARRPDLMFKPDYSAVVKEDCTYLEISVSAYINAYKASLMQRERPLNDLSDVSHNSSAHNSNLSLVEKPGPITDPSAMLVPENVRKPSVVSMDSPKILVGLGQHPVAPVAEEEEMALLDQP